jgi:hypothetical protein
MKFKEFLNETITTKNASSQFIRKNGNDIVPIIKMEKVDGKWLVYIKGESFLRKNLVWTGKKKDGGAIWRDLGRERTNTGPITMKGRMVKT